VRNWQRQERRGGEQKSALATRRDLISIAEMKMARINSRHLVGILCVKKRYFYRINVEIIGRCSALSRIR
jgi:hypothetical protein